MSSVDLTSRGYEVVTARNPDDSYKIIKDSKPDLIVPDVMMNEKDLVYLL